MQEHLTADALERLVHRRCHVSLAYGWLLHLLGCETCRNRLVQDFPGVGEAFLRRIFHTQQPVSMPELGDPEAVDRMLAHLKTDGISSFLETRPLPDYLHTLPDQPEARQTWAVRNSRRLRDPAVIEHLLSQCQVLWHQDVKRAARLAKLAVLVVDHLPPEEVHPQILRELRFEAWGKLGNSLRLLGHFRAAHEALRKARESWNDCVSTPSLRAQHLRYEAWYQHGLAHPELAMNLAYRGEALQRDADAGDRLATLSLVADSLGQLDRWGEARRHLEVGLEEFSVDEVGPLFYAGLLNRLARALIGEGLTPRAWTVLHERNRLLQGGGKLTHLRRSWTDGEFYEQAGELLAAQKLYRRALHMSGELSLEGDQALALIDLTRIQVRRGHSRAARDLAGEATRRLRRLGLGRVAVGVGQMVEGGPLVTS